MKKTNSTLKSNHQDQLATLNCLTCEGRKNGIFCDLSHKSLDALNINKVPAFYKKDQILFNEGEGPFGLYCLHSGKLKVIKSTSSGRETIIRIVGPGDVLGYASLFSETAHSSTAKVIEDAVICLVRKDTVLNLVKSDPKMCFQIMGVVHKQMGADENRIASLTHKSQKERLAELLLLLKETYGVKENSRILLNIRLTREEMGSMIGAATENIIRWISEFKKEGLISESDKMISILKLKKLEQIAKLDLDHFGPT